MSTQVVTLDVRDDIRNGRDPFRRIMEALGGLGASSRLVLLAPFEPRPLFEVLHARGFTHVARPIGSGDWEVVITRGCAVVGEDSAPAAPGQAREVCAAEEGGVIEVDARGLEPPEPMMKVLEALAHLPEGGTLRAHTDRRPMHLYALLEERGYFGESHEQPDGSFITTIRRA